MDRWSLYLGHFAPTGTRSSGHDKEVAAFNSDHCRQLTVLAFTTADTGSVTKKKKNGSYIPSEISAPPWGSNYFEVLGFLNPQSVHVVPKANRPPSPSPLTEVVPMYLDLLSPNTLK